MSYKPAMERKDLIRQYKETQQPAGIYRVRNNRAKKSLIGPSRNLPGMLNRQLFQLKNGSHPDRELQKDWNDLGPVAFTIDILDELEQSDDPVRDVAADLDALQLMWLEKLEAAGELFYSQTKKIRRK